MRIYDISPTLRPGIAVWPGDEAFRHERSLRISQGSSVNLSSVTFSLHTGVHADAPLHFDDDGEAIDQVDLSKYLGNALLVSVEVRESISAQDLEPFLQQKPERLLVRANPGFTADSFPSRFAHFSPEAAQAIGKAGVRLVGIDAPSVDFVDSKELPCHNAFGRAGTAILENLLLAGVPDGEYQLVALPLKISGGDGSPLRAILTTSESA